LVQKPEEERIAAVVPQALNAMIIRIVRSFQRRINEGRTE
jgi:hypothetical protein